MHGGKGVVALFEAKLRDLIMMHVWDLAIEYVQLSFLGKYIREAFTVSSKAVVVFELNIDHYHYSTFKLRDRNIVYS